MAVFNEIQNITHGRIKLFGLSIYLEYAVNLTRNTYSAIKYACMSAVCTPKLRNITQISVTSVDKAVSFVSD